MAAPSIGELPREQLRVLFLMLVYPDVAQDQSMYTDLVQELFRCGCDVRVVCPVGKGTRPGLRSEGGIPVLRVRTGPLFGVGLLRKGWSNLRLSAQFGRAIANSFGHWRPQWLVISTPPITLTPLVARLKRRWGSKAYLILRDIFPQNAIDLGILRAGVISRYFRRLERQTYAMSDVIGCMSPGNCNYLVRRNPGLALGKLQLFPNWMSSDGDSRLDRNTARRTLGFDGEFVCLFGGNLGRPQRVDFLLDVAEAVGPGAQVRFLVVGNGTERERIEHEIVRRQLGHVTIMPWCDRKKYAQVLAAVDLGLILLHESFTIPNIPSRLLSYWKAGLPVLAATDQYTDLGESFLHRHEAGLSVAMGDIAGCAVVIRAMRDDPSEGRRMGLNGRKAFEEHYTSGHSASRLFSQMASADQCRP